MGNTMLDLNLTLRELAERMLAPEDTITRVVLMRTEEGDIQAFYEEASQNASMNVTISHIDGLSEG